VKEYGTDNAVFNVIAFNHHIVENHQRIRYCGVNAHHQNGVAERAIQTVVTQARALLLHAMLRWPDTTTQDLWPMAMQHTEYLSNRLPRMANGMSAEKIFTQSMIGAHELQKVPVWGCPVYVLDPTLQASRKLPKWSKQSRRGEYMGHSRKHASTVYLVRNLKTGRIGPQYHVVVDRWFETVHSRMDDADDDELQLDDWKFMHRHWVDLSDEVVDLSLDDEWLTADEIAEKKMHVSHKRERSSNVPHPTVLQREPLRSNESHATIPRESPPASRLMLQFLPAKTNSLAWQTQLQCLTKSKRKWVLLLMTRHQQ